MKEFRFLLFLSVILAGALLPTNAQKNLNAKANFGISSTDQIKIVNQHKFTKAEVTALKNIMKSSGNNLAKAVKSSPGESHQYLVTKVNSEFRKMDTEYAKVLSGAKLTAWKNLSNKHKNQILKSLQSNYIGAAKGARAGIRTSLRAGIRSTLINSFGGADVGF